MEHRCNVCNKVYASYQSLWNHNKIKHTHNTTLNPLKVLPNPPNSSSKNVSCKIDKLTCDICKIIFSRSDNLKRHRLKCCKKYEDNLYKQQIEKLTEGFEKLKHKINKKSTKKIILFSISYK